MLTHVIVESPLQLQAIHKKIAKTNKNQKATKTKFNSLAAPVSFFHTYICMLNVRLCEYVCE